MRVSSDTSSGPDAREAGAGVSLLAALSYRAVSCTMGSTSERAIPSATTSSTTESARLATLKAMAKRPLASVPPLAKTRAPASDGASRIATRSPRRGDPSGAVRRTSSATVRTVWKSKEDGASRPAVPAAAGRLSLGAAVGDVERSAQAATSASRASVTPRRGWMAGMIIRVGVGTTHRTGAWRTSRESRLLAPAGPAIQRTGRIRRRIRAR